MKAFVDLVVTETTTTIEGLMGKTPSVSHTQDDSVSLENLPTPYAISYIQASGDGNGEIAMVIPVEMGTALADMMLGGEGEVKSEMSDDDLDAIKEISSNIFGAVSTSLNSQNELPKLNFTCSNIEFITENMDLSRFDKAYIFNFTLDSIQSNFTILANKSFVELFEGGNTSAQAAPAESAAQTNPALSATEYKNINMILDVRLNVKVRIGQKRMLLKDVIAMDIGSVIELNQLANDPLEILVDDKVIAKGEVVIVDGNFGIQITDIGTKRDRLEQLRG
ncbi:flagellar motor switch protein FliY [Helicobacter sp. MIT 03-1614]|jgi:flagellar motor switch protein FliN/FliY|uniref:Flagellar motor switch protein FliN n=1 Tax=Helicobacter hepaticus (strain ATCC 51449 / 3B1) TaxID=235279 RepID=Q7VH19_HELHP|nr:MULTISPECIES: flagellar motor switch protein FliY [Helicobacter]AAP77745.1 flagellar protein FliY [Helicobacter hepaticus ATCC 51449]TLD90925.1 flagellar motor switch protein FliY [Helicobacter sp. MIT 03-1614]